MPTAAVILDTNVVVAALITGDRRAATRRILAAALAGRLPLLISAELIDEYRSVLARPAIRKLHGLSAAQIDIILLRLIQLGEIVAGDAKSRAPDPKDNFLYGLLAIRTDAVLVTGDLELLEDKAFPGRVITPREFVERDVPPGVA